MKIGLTLPLQIDYAVKGVPLAITSGEGVPFALRDGASPAIGGVNDHTRAVLETHTAMVTVIAMEMSSFIEMTVLPIKIKVLHVVEMKGPPAVVVQRSTHPVRGELKRWFSPNGHPAPAGQAQLNLAGDLVEWRTQSTPISSSRLVADDSNADKPPAKSDNNGKSAIIGKIWLPVKLGGNNKSRDQGS